MTLDESHVPWQELARQAEDERTARDFADYQEQRLLESVECEEAKWSGIFGRMAYERPQVWHDERPAIDRRLFAVEGDLIEQARRDRDVPTLPGHVA